LEAKDKLDSVQDYEGNDYRWQGAEHLFELADASGKLVRAFLNLRDTFNKLSK